ncbi:MAG: hypothetical protein ACJAWV_000200 [Flammeovirgaceae bacterium]|jgi:hypothetical protein
MNKKVATILSYLTHPGLMPTVLFAIILFLGKSLFPADFKYKITLLGFIFNFTFILPALLIYVLVIRGKISNLNIRNREERIFPFSIVTICYTLLVFMFQTKLSGLYLVTEIIASIAITQAVCTIITTRFKISIHGVAIGGVLGVLWALEFILPELDFLYPILILTILAGLTMTARLALGAHTPKQVAYGFFVGIFLNFGFVYWLG